MLLILLLLFAVTVSASTNFYSPTECHWSPWHCHGSPVSSFSSTKDAFCTLKRHWQCQPTQVETADSIKQYYLRIACPRNRYPLHNKYWCPEHPTFLPDKYRHKSWCPWQSWTSWSAVCKEDGLKVAPHAAKWLANGTRSFLTSSRSRICRCPSIGLSGCRSNAKQQEWRSQPLPASTGFTSLTCQWCSWGLTNDLCKCPRTRLSFYRRNRICLCSDDTRRTVEYLMNSPCGRLYSDGNPNWDGCEPCRKRSGNYGNDDDDDDDDDKAGSSMVASFAWFGLVTVCSIFILVCLTAMCKTSCSNDSSATQQSQPDAEITSPLPNSSLPPHPPPFPTSTTGAAGVPLVTVGPAVSCDKSDYDIPPPSYSEAVNL